MVTNMELVFLNKDDLSVLDYGYVEKDFQLVIDSVIPQKSTFNVNKININAEVGDLLIIKDSNINYIGIILSIQIDENNETENNSSLSLITTSKKKSIFDFENLSPLYVLKKRIRLAFYKLIYVLPEFLFGEEDDSKN